MPIENPPPRGFFAKIETGLHALSFYGAAGIATFGWAMGHLMGLEARRAIPLWFSGALLIYNADRLRRDPADVLNLPARTAASARWRGASRVVLALAAVVLVGLPLWRRDWPILGLVLAGSLVALGYSIPFLGFRWKDVPLVKTLFAPAIVTAAIFGLLLLGMSAIPARHTFASRHHELHIFSNLMDRSTLLAGWSFCFLLFNMLLCDLRDLVGDRQCGIRSIPVLCGEKGTRALLWAMAVVGQLLLIRLLPLYEYRDLSLTFLSFLTGLYQAWLLHATRQPRSEQFYEWAVEGLLYLPALACALAPSFPPRISMCF